MNTEKADHHLTPLSTRQSQRKSRPQLWTKENLSQGHFFAAELFASECEAIEKEQSSMPWPQPRLSEHQSYVIGTVIVAVAALEAFINEFYDAVFYGERGRLGALSKIELLQLESERGDTEENRMSILKKYKLVLRVANKPTMDTDPSHGAIKDLIALRDRLVHFKPEWQDDLEKHQQLENALAPRFAESQLASSRTVAWFPRRCLGAGCARWACETVRDFTDAFCRELEIRPRFP